MSLLGVCELKNLHNARIEELLKENEKLNLVVKKFTTSQQYQNDMLDGIGTYSHRQGLGFRKKN